MSSDDRAKATSRMYFSRFRLSHEWGKYFRKRYWHWLVFVAAVSTVCGLTWIISSYAFQLPAIECFGVASAVGALLLTFTIAVQQDATLQKLEDKQDQAQHQLERGRRDYDIEQRAARFFWAHEHKGGTTYYCRRLEKQFDGFNLPFTPVSEDASLNVVTRLLEKCEKDWKTLGYNCAVPEYSMTARQVGDPTIDSFVEPADTQKSSIYTSHNQPIVSFDPNDEVFSKTGIPLVIKENKIVQRKPSLSWEDGENRYHGLLGRVRLEDGHRFILTGPNQWGTRVAGIFLDRLTNLDEDEASRQCSLNLEEYSALLGDAPFLAVIEALLDGGEPQIVWHLDCVMLWVEKGNEWVPAEQVDNNQHVFQVHPSHELHAPRRLPR